MNIKRYLPNGWTVTFFVIAALFCIGLTEQGIMAAAFFATLGLFNEAMSRI